MTASPKVLSAGVVVTRPGPPPRRYLVLRAYRYWDFPKGEVVPGESALVAATREVAEETGLADLSFTWGHDYWQTPVYGRGKAARYFVAQSAGCAVELPVCAELGRPEHHEFRWATLDEARGLLAPRVMAALEWAAARVGESSS